MSPSEILFDFDAKFQYFWRRQPIKKHVKLRHCSLSLHLALILLLFAADVAFGDNDRRLTSTKYGNARFGYEVSYPPDLLIPQGEAENGDGQCFLSREGDVELCVWGSHNAMDETIQSNFQKDIQEKTPGHPDKSVTFKQIKGSTYVVSGYLGDKIFYQKTIHIPQDDIFTTCYLIYPADKKQEFDSVVTSISKSFQITVKSSP